MGGHSRKGQTSSVTQAVLQGPVDIGLTQQVPEIKSKMPTEQGKGRQSRVDGDGGAGSLFAEGWQP